MQSTSRGCGDRYQVIEAKKKKEEEVEKKALNEKPGFAFKHQFLL